MSESVSEAGDELFRCPDLLVRRVAGHGSDCCVVTFDSFTDHRTLDRQGFGQLFFHISGIDAIHVIPRGNDWYGYAEMADAMRTVHAATRRYRRVTTYGSSMGAYAAIRFAGLAGADAVLALSPQFSIAPSVARWEQRWIEHGKQFDPRWERTLPFPAIADACVIFDSTDRDAKHVKALGRRFRFHAIDLPYAGHPVTGCLAEIGLLQGLALDMCRGSLDRARFRALALDRLQGTSHYLTSRAKSLPVWRRQDRLALMQRAVTVAPQDFYVYRCLGIELRKAGRYEESLAMHHQALALNPEHPNLLLEYSLTLAAIGDVTGAIEILEDVHRREGGEPIYRTYLDAMRDRLRPGLGGFLRRMSSWARHRA